MSKKINFPTILTILRMILAFVFLVLMLCGMNICNWDTRFSSAETMQPCNSEEIAFFIAAITVFIAAAITDKIDGDYARKHNQVTELGKFLDPLADKMLVNTAFLLFVAMGVVPVWAFALILWRDFAVDGMRMMVAAKGEVVAASIWGKAKTMTQMVTLVLLLLNLILENVTLTVIGLVLMYVVVILTVFSGVDYLVKGLKKI